MSRGLKRFATDELSQLFDNLKADGYRLIGPTIKDACLALAPITSIDELPRGLIDHQEKGLYRLIACETSTYFGVTLGPESWKKYLFPDHRIELEVTLDQPEPSVRVPPSELEKYALIGVRSCDVHAIHIQANVRRKARQQIQYEEPRLKPFILAVNCSRAAATCFCTSLGTGPEVTMGYDLVLTECCNQDEHFFAINCGSEAGERALRGLQLADAREIDQARVDESISQVKEQMQRRLDDALTLNRFLSEHLDHAMWDEVATRCLACANCTMVCPTCFCSTVEDRTDLARTKATRVTRWDSCFNVDFSYIHGGSIRQSIKSRYRQWLTHKLGTWIDQFGQSGCVGCGRCISWCPVGIDITEEIAKLKADTSVI